MFTGLVHGQGKISVIERLGMQSRIGVNVLCSMPKLTIGESIAVNGACLTVEHAQEHIFYAFVSAETLRHTTLGRLQVGSLVNLERALRMGDPLGGHIVSGHIDAVGTVQEITDEGMSKRVCVAFPNELAPEIVAKGSITIDGISLTVNACDTNSFTVNIIPETWRVTTATMWKKGYSVNLETDILGKYVHRYLTLSSSAEKQGEHVLQNTYQNATHCNIKSNELTLQMLQENGFI